MSGPSVGHGGLIRYLVDIFLRKDAPTAVPRATANLCKRKTLNYLWEMKLRQYLLALLQANFFGDCRCDKAAARK